MYNLFKNSKETAYYLSPDKINDLLLLPPESEDSKITPVLACNDRVLRVLDESMLVYETEIVGRPTTLTLYNSDGGESGREVLYGTSDGKIGLIELAAHEPVLKWETANDDRLSGISCLDNYDITNDGIIDLLVGREDGIVEVYSYNSLDQPFLKYTYVLANLFSIDLSYFLN